MEHTPLSPRRVSELERPQCSRPALGPFLLAVELSRQGVQRTNDGSPARWRLKEAN